MKIYPNLVYAVADGLDEVFGRGFRADHVVSHLLKRDKRWGSRDRAFIAETLYDCVRWWRLLVHLAEGDDRPESVISTYFAWRHGELLDVEGFPYVHPRETAAGMERVRHNRAVAESIPDWLDELGLAELGEELWNKELPALNEPADVFLRVNTLKTDRQKLKDSLEQQGFELAWVPEAEDALRVVVRRNLWSTKQFKSGHFEIQDVASQLVVPALDVSPGMTVVDACAGAGGKTLQLAALMQNKGRLIALDTEVKKLQELKRRARRAGVQNLETRLIGSSKVIKRLYGKADRVLLDVPCTGLGVLRRNPDAKWKLRPEFVDEVKVWQRDILAQYPRMAKPDGKVVYATCSLLQSEGEEQVQAYLNNSEAEVDWKLALQTRYWPSEGMDGFFVAKLER